MVGGRGIEVLTSGAKWTPPKIRTDDGFYAKISSCGEERTSSADTLDKVDLRALKGHAGIAAVTVFNIADRPKRLGRRLSREDVQFLLEDTGLDDQMKLLEVWEDWEQGRRGRAR